MGSRRGLSSSHSSADKARRWARKLVTENGAEHGPDSSVRTIDLVAGVAARVCDAIGVGSADDALGNGCRGHDLGGWTIGDRIPLTADPEPPGGWANPWVIGWVHEQAVTAAERRRRGAWYTPESVVRGLVDLAWTVWVSLGDDPEENPPPLVVDPTCGSGAFLLAGLDRLVEHGLTPPEALVRVAGRDIDPVAVVAARWSVLAWAAAGGVDVCTPPTSIPVPPAGAGRPPVSDDAVDPQTVPDVDLTVGDALGAIPEHWPGRRMVVGNPPFATPLRSGQVPPEAERYRLDHQNHLGQYADLAAIHLHRAVAGCDAGSVVAFVQPQSVVSSRDTEPLRQFLEGCAPPAAMWAARESVFEAGVRTCAPVLAVGSTPPDEAILAAGPDAAPVGSGPGGTWSDLAARALGAPDLPSSVVAKQASTLADLASGATAGFRDEYYGLAAACREWDGPPGDEVNRLLTVGSVEPLATSWSRRPLRLAGQLWDRPWADPALLNESTARWWERQRRPKVVLATQSRLLEPVVDPDGRLIPCTPLVAVHGEPDDLAMIAAVLLSPPVVAAAWQRWFGAALAVDALKLAAVQVLQLPLPPDRNRWRQAAAMIELESVDRTVEEGWSKAIEVATVMNQAYRSTSQVMDWWLARVPPRFRP